MGLNTLNSLGKKSVIQSLAKQKKKKKKKIAMEFGRKSVIVRQVFANNLERELLLVYDAIYKYPLVSIDTEFPGTLFKPTKAMVQAGNPILNYHYMKRNVDALNIIQLGLTLSDSEGNLPDFGGPYCYIWEFNFNDFDLERDEYDKDSIELLKRQGIDFAKNKEEGIDSRDFAAMVLSCGLFSNRLTWITFHGAYDFGFLLKILTQEELPVGFGPFMDQLVYFFGANIYDVKHTFKFFGLFGGLENVAKRLNVARQAGSSHQAGSDSLLTLQCFMELKKLRVFENYHCGMLPKLALYGLISA